VVQRFGKGEVEVQAVFVSCFPRSVSIQTLKNYLRFIDQKVTIAALIFKGMESCRQNAIRLCYKGNSSFSLVYLLKITSLDSPKFQKLAKLKKE
jgi:hypothetical protein